LHNTSSQRQLLQPKSHALLEQRYEYLKHKYQDGSGTIPVEVNDEKAYRSKNHQGLVRLTVMGIPNLTTMTDEGQTK